MLAKALLDCHKNAQAAGEKGLGLRVFIAGRNRLENEGATALAEVFKVTYISLSMLLFIFLFFYALKLNEICYYSV